MSCNAVSLSTLEPPLGEVERAKFIASEQAKAITSGYFAAPVSLPTGMLSGIQVLVL